jgi:hypothetical protein
MMSKMAIHCLLCRSMTRSASFGHPSLEQPMDHLTLQHTLIIAIKVIYIYVCVQFQYRVAARPHLKKTTRSPVPTTQSFPSPQSTRDPLFSKFQAIAGRISGQIRGTRTVLRRFCEFMAPNVPRHREARRVFNARWELEQSNSFKHVQSISK